MESVINIFFVSSKKKITKNVKHGDYIYEHQKSNSHRLLLNISDKINLKRSDKYVVLSHLSIYYTWNSIKKSYNNNKFF